MAIYLMPAEMPALLDVVHHLVDWGLSIIDVTDAGDGTQLVTIDGDIPADQLDHLRLTRIE